MVSSQQWLCLTNPLIILTFRTTTLKSEASENTKGSQPKRIFTDGLEKYREGISFAFDGKKPEYIARVGIKKPHATNNRIERLNGTVRERTKIQRGWKTMETPLAEGQRIHYNFVKPHEALDGQTPAQAAGVGIQNKDKWLELLKRALE